MGVLMKAMLAMRAVFQPKSGIEKNTAALEANTQAIVASSKSIARRADEFIRLVNGMRMESRSAGKPGKRV